MQTIQDCHACGLCYGCAPAQSRALVAVNPQCHRRGLKYPLYRHHGTNRPAEGLRHGRASVSQQSHANSSSSATQYKTTTKAQLDSADLPQDLPQSVKAQEFAGLGAQRTLNFLAAWDQLALRLPPQAGMGKATELILNALKLEVSHLPPPSESDQAAASASKAMAVASQLADLSGQGFPLDAESIAAGILVDAVAAQRLSLGLVDDRLGPSVANLIEDIVKVRKLPSRVDLYDDVASSALRELALTFYDTRAIVVELVARLVGMERLVGTPLYARQLAALEALQIYAPLGHGLGLRPLCAQLEDRCFQELFPESYAETAAWLRREVSANGDSLARCEQQLQEAVEQDPHFQSLAAGCQVAGRTKSLFSTMKKLLRLDSIEAGGRARQEVHDILASRCVVTPRPDLPQPQAEELARQACYVVAAKAAQLFEEVSNRHKDYIACPKHNGYQSLHCTVKLPPVTVECEAGQGIGPADAAPEECWLKSGPTCELQIRTQRMHELAESGGAAHAAYKGGLDALQATRLQAWTHTLRTLAPALSSTDKHQPQEWSNQAAAAEELFSHLDRDGDGYISVGEVAVLLEELGIDAEEQHMHAPGQDAGQLPGSRAGQKLLAALANKEPSRVTFEEFLQFNSQASLLGALPKVDTETARSLRRSTSASQEALPEAAHPPAASQSAMPIASQSISGHSSNTGSDQDSTIHREALSDEEHTASSSGLSEPDSHSSQSDALQHSMQSRHIAGKGSETSAGSTQCSSPGFASFSRLLAIPHTSTAQSLAKTPFSEASSSAQVRAHEFQIMPGHSGCRSSIVCHASQPGLQFCADTSVHTLSARSRLGKQARCRGRAIAGLFQSSHLTGLSAAACSSSGFTAAAASSSSWRLHAVGSQGTTAESAGSEVASSPLDEATPPGSQDSPSDMSDAIKRAIDDAAIIDSRSSGQQASSSSSSQDHPDDGPGSASDLLSTKHNKSTLSLDLSQLPEPSAPLPAPQPTTKQPGQQSSQQSTYDDSSDAAQLLRKGHNESTISLDLNSLPVPPELSRPPARPQRQPTRAPPQDPNSFDSSFWDEAEPKQPSSSRSGTSSQPQRQRLTSGSWDNLQPLFKPPPRADPPREPQEPPNAAAAADLMFSALQSRRYKHQKGTSYKDATFALVPVDRKIGWRLSCDEELTVGQSLHLPQHGPLLLGGGSPLDTLSDVMVEGAGEAGDAVKARLELFWKGRKPCCLVTCLGPCGDTYINRTRLPRMVDTEAYLGDILSFGELTMAFQFVPILQPERQKSALDNAVHYANMHADGRRVPKDYELVARTVRELSKKGTRQFAEARALMSSSLSRDPFCAEGWAQIANMEYRMVLKNLPMSSIPSARMAYRAAAELLQQVLDANASPNGEAKPGSQRHKNLMAGMTSFIRMMSSWAQMEFDCMNKTTGRRLYRRGLQSVPADPMPQGKDLEQAIKLLFKWAHQEFIRDNLFQSRDLLQSLLKLEADNTRALGMLGSLEWKAGNHELAREHLVAAVEANPKHVANLHTLARLELAEGNLQEARELFARGQQLEPHNAYVLQSWALAEAGEGDMDLARDMLQKATEVQPKSVPCWHAWAKLELQAGDVDKARKLYLKALELNPRETFTQSALGALERKAGNYEVALTYLDTALGLTPRHPAACVEKAMILRRQGKPNQADKFTEMAYKESTQLSYKRGNMEKTANQFVRSSEQQQEERKARSQSQSQAQARKTAATQKGSKTHVNRMRRKRKAAAKAKAGAAEEQSNVPFERVVSVSE